MSNLPSVGPRFAGDLQGEMDKHQSQPSNEHQAEKKHWFQPTDPYNAPVEELKWVIEGFAAKGMITILGGVAGSGKSMLMQYLLQLRGRQDFIVANSGNGIYLTGLDSSETELRRRATSIGKGNGLKTVQVPDEPLPFITNKTFFKDLKEKSIEYGIDAIVFDTLADFHQGSLYEAADANATMSSFRRLAEATDAAIILITHTRKSAEQKRRYTVNDIADSRIFGTKSDFVFAIKNEYKNDSSNLIELQCLKSRSPQSLADLRALICYNSSEKHVSFVASDRPFSSEQEDVEEQKQIQKRRKKAMALRNDGLTNREIANKLDVSHTTINNDIKICESTKQE